MVTRKTPRPPVYGSFPVDHSARPRELRPEEKIKLKKPHRLRSILLQLGMFVAIVALWAVPVVNPVKLLVVLFHETSHMFAAYATGGVPFGIAIDPAGGGVTLGMGGNELIVASAGYAGCLVIGVFLYWLSAIWGSEDVWLALWAMSCLSLAFGWLNDFTAAFGYGTLFLMAVGYFGLSEIGKTLFLRLVAATCCLYPIIDVLNEGMLSADSAMRVNGNVIGSDVAQITELTGVPETLLITLFTSIGLAICLFLIVWAAEKDAENAIKRRFFRPRFRDLDPIYDPHDPKSIREYVIR